MSVVSVKEAKPTGCLQRITNFDLKARKYTRTFIAICDSLNDDGWDIYAHTDCPKTGDAHPKDSFALVENVKTEPIGGGGEKVPRIGGGFDTQYAWSVEVDYSTDAENPDPLSRPAVYSWTRASYEKPADKDLNGDPLLNSAGQAFDPPVMKDDSRSVLKITRNEATFDDAAFEPFQDAINLTEFKGRPAFTWKCAGITGEEKRENHVDFFEVTYEFHYRKETWIKSILDQGRYELFQSDASSEVSREGSLVFNDFGGVLKPIRDSARNLISDPVPLNGRGKRAMSQEEAFYFKFEVYDYADFDELEL